MPPGYGGLRSESHDYRRQWFGQGLAAGCYLKKAGFRLFHRSRQDRPVLLGQAWIGPFKVQKVEIPIYRRILAAGHALPEAGLNDRAETWAAPSESWALIALRICGCCCSEDRIQRLPKREGTMERVLPPRDAFCEISQNPVGKLYCTWYEGMIGTLQRRDTRCPRALPS